MSVICLLLMSPTAAGDPLPEPHSYFLIIDLASKVNRGFAIIVGFLLKGKSFYHYDIQASGYNGRTNNIK